MKFTLTIPNDVYEYCQMASEKHGVRLATILNCLIRRGIISGCFVRFRPMQDDYEFKKMLGTAIKELDKEISTGFDDWFGLDISGMSKQELFDISEGNKAPADVLPPDDLELLQAELDAMEDDPIWDELDDDYPLPMVNTAASTEEIISQHLAAMGKIGALINQKLAAAGDELES